MCKMTYDFFCFVFCFALGFGLVQLLPYISRHLVQLLERHCISFKCCQSPCTGDFVLAGLSGVSHLSAWHRVITFEITSKTTQRGPTETHLKSTVSLIELFPSCHSAAPLCICDTQRTKSIEMQGCTGGGEIDWVRSKTLWGNLSCNPECIGSGKKRSFKQRRYSRRAGVILQSTEWIIPGIFPSHVLDEL